MATRDIVERMQGSHRLLLHGRVNPNQPGDLEDMERLAKFGIVAWKTYTQCGPGRQRLLHDRRRRHRVLRARARARHPATSPSTRDCRSGRRATSTRPARDIGPIAKRFPDLNFLIYHSGFVAEGRRRAVRCVAHRWDRCARHLARESRRRTEHATSTRSSVRPGASSRCASPTRRRTRSASSSSIAARTTCSGARIRSGTARRRTRSRRSAPSRSRPSCATSTDIPRSRRSCARRCSR